MADHSEQRQLVSAIKLVPPGARLVGRVTSEIPYRILIAGEYAGSIELAADSVLEIEQGACVDAEEIRASTIIVRGTVNGHLVGDQVHLMRGAHVTGSIRYLTFSSEPGAWLAGRLDPVTEP